MEDKDDSFSCEDIDIHNSDVDTQNSELYNILTEHFPLILPVDDNSENWRPAVEELIARLPSLVQENHYFLKAAMERTYELMFYCPNSELSSLYRELSVQMSSMFPDCAKDYHFEPPTISRLFHKDVFPSFEDIEKFIKNRNKQYEDQGGDPEDFDNLSEAGTDNKVYIYENKVFASFSISHLRLKEAVVGIFNFFNGVFPNIFRVYLFFPDHLINFWNTFEQVVINGGPLSLPKRLIVGMLVAISFDCGYLYRLLYAKYEAWGSSMKYLKDPKKFPKDLLTAKELIVRLALNPCSLMTNPEVIGKLISGGKTTLSSTQILHIGSLVSVFSGLCTVAESLKIVPEQQVSQSVGTIETAIAIDCFMKKDKASVLTQYLPNEADIDNFSKDEEIEEETPLSKSTQETAHSMQTLSQVSSKKSSSEGDSQKDYPLGLMKQNSKDLPVFGSQLATEKQKFFEEIDLEACTYPKTFKLTKFLESKNFNFWTEGLAILDRVLHEQTESLEKELVHVTSMTFNNFGSNEQVSTKQFRKAILMYVKKLFAINHDDYDYRKINKLFTSKTHDDKQDKDLVIAFKGLIKKMATSPGELSPTDYMAFAEKMMFFTHELVHIVFLVAAAKEESILSHLTAALEQQGVN